MYQYRVHYTLPDGSEQYMEMEGASFDNCRFRFRQYFGSTVKIDYINLIEGV